VAVLTRPSKFPWPVLPAWKEVDDDGDLASTTLTGIVLATISYCLDGEYCVNSSGCSSSANQAT